MRHRSSDPSAPSGTSWGSPIRTRVMRATARSLAVSVVAALGVSVAAAPSHAAATPAYDPASDPYSMANTTDLIGASTWWDAGYTGAGVDVAMIDTGVSQVEGLKTPGKVIYGPDLSLESQAPNLTNLDTNGHGTFMAGLIAGHDSNLSAPYSAAPASVYRGVAPDARLVSLKVATADGGVDVSQVIAAIDWVVQHKDDNGMHIRVLNISYGTNSRQNPAVDPLSYAAEQAWKAGIVVVAAAGNTGYQTGFGAPGLADPASNPYVIAVGGYDPNGTATTADDIVGAYSASGTGCPSCRRPDFLAVGSHVRGLRVPNSYIDVNHPEARLGDRFFRGSGTSEAAAMTSGAVALVLQKYPNLTPDQVKAFLRNASDRPSLSAAWASVVAGKGELNLSDLAASDPPPWAVQWLASSTGTGSLEAARGSDHLTANGVMLTGEQDIFGMPFDSNAMATLEAAGSSWSGGVWNGSTWSGSSWSGSSWSGSTWSGSSWSGSSWSGSTWSGSTWSGSSWSGSTWSGSSWSGSSWSGHTWSADSWA
jgi:serine protease AprX